MLQILASFAWWEWCLLIPASIVLAWVGVYSAFAFAFYTLYAAYKYPGTAFFVVVGGSVATIVSIFARHL